VEHFCLKSRELTIYMQTTSLGNAYGVCVILVTMITTFLVALVAILIWRFPVYLVLPVFLIFFALDGAYTTAVLTKVPEGAWFTLLLGAILSIIFILWRFGKEHQWSAESLGRLEASALIDGTSTSSSEDVPCLKGTFGGAPISTVEGLGVFFDKSGDRFVVPVSFAQFLIKFAARPRVLIFFHMRPLSVPFVDPSERYVVTRGPAALGPSCYYVTLRHGYADDVIKPGLGAELISQVELAISSRPDLGEPERLHTAYETQTVYVLGKETMRVRKDKGVGALCRRTVLECFLWLRENSRAKLADLDIEPDRLVEVGFLKEI
jgi:KUP system potassium uptake protein